MTIGYWSIGLGLGSNWLLLWRSHFVSTWLWKRLLVSTFQKKITSRLSRKSQQLKTEVSNLGDTSPWRDARGLNSVIFWVHLYQWRDAIDVRGDADTKKVENPWLKKSSLNSLNILKSPFYDIVLIKILDLGILKSFSWNIDKSQTGLESQDPQPIIFAFLGNLHQF